MYVNKIFKIIYNMRISKKYRKYEYLEKNFQNLISKWIYDKILLGVDLNDRKKWIFRFIKKV